LVKGLKGQHIDSTNFRSDVSSDGYIGSADVRPAGRTTTGHLASLTAVSAILNRDFEAIGDSLAVGLRKYLKIMLDTVPGGPA